MKKYSSIIKASAMAMMVSCLFSNTVSAAYFNDVPASYRAYEAINAISSRGILVGDMSSNFNPEAPIDKFTAAKALAVAAGYNYETASAEKKLEYDNIYKNYSAFLKQYNNAFKKWNTAVDKEISFLIDKKIITSSDLDQFVIKDIDSSERVRNLDRGDMAVFFVRLMGKQTEAEDFKNSGGFKDDYLIPANKKGSVYYLKSLGIINGNSNGTFNSSVMVTRADFCVVLNKILALNTEGAQTESLQNTQNKENAAYLTHVNNTENNITSVSGRIIEYFASMNVIQADINGEAKLYKISQSASIKINSAVSTASALASAKGMSFTAVLNNSEVIQLEATGESGEASVQSDSAKAANIIGTVKAITISQFPEISLELSDGTVKSYPAATENVSMYYLKVGDKVTLRVKNGKVQSVLVNEKAAVNSLLGALNELNAESISLIGTETLLDGVQLSIKDVSSIIDSKTGEAVDISALKKGSLVYVVLDALNNVKFITVL